MAKQDLQSNRVFISHSSRDKATALKLANLLGKNVWIDMLDLDSGQMLPKSIAEGIQASKWFILLASNASMASRWVRYELNLALVRWIEEANCEIVVARIDDCELHAELKPFLYIDSPNRPDEAIYQLAKRVTKTESTSAKSIKERRQRVVNRFEELEAIERLIHENVRFIHLYGLYGIGKTTVVSRAVEEILQMKLVQVPLTEAHGILRLCLELCAKAGRPLPKPTSTAQECVTDAADAVRVMAQKQMVLLLDDVENVMQEDWSFRPFFTRFLETVNALDDAPIPVFLCSTRYPQKITISERLGDRYHEMKIGGLNDEDLLNCLSNWLGLTVPKQPLPNREKLFQLARQLHGYPLAARLAAYYVARHSVDSLIAETRHFKNLRVDLAKQLIGRTRQKLTDEEAECMQVLAVADKGSTVEDLCAALQVEPARLQPRLESLSSTLMIYADNGRIQIHPLVKDYFWQLSYDSNSWRAYALRLAEQAERQIPRCPKDSEDFVNYATQAYRLFTVSGNLDRARKLAYDLIPELREAAIRLYHAREVNLALQYIDMWLSHEPEDHDLRWFRGRCLTRMKKYEAAETEFNSLKAANYRLYKVYHGLGLLRRDQQRLEEAASFFRQGLEDRRNYLPLLRELAESLERLGDSKAALQIIKEAVDLAPRDLHVLPKYAELLERTGLIPDAVEVLRGAIATFPEEAIFYHRMSKLLDNQGKLEDAVTYAQSAVNLLQNARKLPEIRLHLAALELRVGDTDKAERLLHDLPTDLEWREAQIRDNIRADILLRQGDLEGARKLIATHDMLADPYSVRLAVQIEINDAMNAATRTQRVYACERLKIAKTSLDDGLNKYPTNTYLIELAGILDQLVDAYGC